MNLMEMADFVCHKVGQTDEDSLAQGKRFLNARLRMLWDGALWRESLCLVSLPVAQDSTWLILPAAIDRVLKVRLGGDPALAPLESATVFDYAPELFESGGGASAFASFAPVVCGSGQGADTFVATQTTGPAAAQDAGKKAQLELERADGSRVVESVAGDGFGFPFAETGVFIVRFSKEITAGDYKVGLADGNPLSITILAAETELPRRPRIRLLRRAGAATTALILAKRSYPGFTQDFEQPALPHAGNALVAFASADMLERQRQFAKAQLKLQEAQQQLALLRDLELNQSASEMRIIPA